MRTALTIAGSDASGGAGIQADIKTMSALGVFAMSVIVSVVAENTSRVISIEDVSPQVISDQIDAVFEDIPPDAVKVGMLSTPECMRTVAAKLREYRPGHVVIDPVMYAKNGAPLMQESSIGTLIDEVIPLATVLTPNIPEAEKIAGLEIRDLDGMKRAAEKIAAMGCGAVLVKGGHRIGNADDLLFDGSDFIVFPGSRIDTKNTHGTGCTLSSAIASYLAKGYGLADAVAKAKDYVTGAIAHALELGHGNGPTDHFFMFREVMEG